MHDVFLSYNSKNRAEAQAIVLVLERRGLSVFWDRGYLRLGRPWVEALEGALSLTKAVVVLIGPEGLGRWQRREVDAALDRQTRDPELQVLPVLLPHAHPLPLFLGLNTWVDFQIGLDDAATMEILVASLTGEISSLEQTRQADAIRELVCPYRGLSSFREDDAEYFFGRETVVDQLIAALDTSRFVALVGSSGSGKSSVVHAGLIPRLRRTKREDISDFAFMKPTDQPLEALAACLFPLVEPDKMGLEKLRGIKALAKDLEEPIDLEDLIKTGRRKLGSTGHLLLVVDQWEELYTLCRNGQAHDRFVDLLHDAMGKGLLSIVCTIREDFVPRARDEVDLGDRFERNRVYLHHMKKDELLVAIEEPARKVGLTLEEGLAERILDDLGDEPGQLPLLEFVLMELWKRRKEGKLQHETYVDLGGGRKAIAARAEEIFNELDARDQPEVRRLFLLLVRPGEGTQDTRRRAALLETEQVAGKVMWPLVDARLLTTSAEESDEEENPENIDPGKGTIEITHEALLTHWDRLRKWLAEDREFLFWREKLRLARSTWEHEGRPAGFLLTQAPLVEAEKWLWTKRGDLSPAEADFIKESSLKRQQELEEETWTQQLEAMEEARQQRERIEREARREQDKREQEFFRQIKDAEEKARKKRNQAWLAAGIALILLAVAIFGLRFWRLSLARALAAEAAELHAGPLDIALLLSVQAEKTADTLEAHGSLLTLLEQSQELQAFLPGHGGRVSRVAFSPDGRRFATAGTDEIFLWDAETGQRIDPPFHGHAGQVLDIAFSPDGSVLASCGKDKTIRLWQVGNHQPLGSPKDLEDPVKNLVFSPDGKVLAASQAGSILLWDYPNLQSREEIKAHKSWISRLAFRKDGLLAASSNDGTISFWNIDRREKVRSLSGHKTQVLDLAFSPDGRTLASGGWDRTIRLWDSETGQQLGESITAHRDAVLSVAFSTDGKTLASAGLDKVIHLWDIVNSRFEQSLSHPPKTLFGHGKAVWTLAFGEEGHLVSGGDEASAILWNLKAPPRLAMPVKGITEEIDSVAYSPDGALLAMGGHDGVIRLWDTIGEQMRTPLQSHHKGAVYALVFRQGRLFSGGEDGQILIWDVDHPQNQPQVLQEASGRPISSLALSSDDKILAVGDDKGGVELWDVAPPKLRGEMKEHDRGAVLGLSFSPDGRLLAAGGAEGLIRIWDVSTRRLLRAPLKGHDNTVTGLAFDPAGRTLASASADRTVQLWDAKTWQPLTGSPLTGPEDMLTALAFSPKGDRLAASVLNGTVFLWDVDRRLPIGAGLRGAGKALNIAFHPDGEHLAAASENSAILFDLRYNVWRDEACGIAKRNLTQREWSKYLPYEPYRQTCPPEKWTAQ